MGRPNAKKGRSRVMKWADILDNSKDQYIIPEFRKWNAAKFEKYDHKDILTDFVLNKLEQTEIWKLDDIRDGIKVAKKQKNKTLVKDFSKVLDHLIKKFTYKMDSLWINN